MTALAFDARQFAPAIAAPEHLGDGPISDLMAAIAAARPQRAAELAGLGLRVIELYGVWRDSSGAIRCTCGNPSCGKNTGKHPRLPMWQKTELRSPAEAEAMFDARRISNVGVLTGFGVDVLDVDERNGGPTSIAVLEAEYGPLPPTPTVVTGNGLHRYFRSPAESIGCSNGEIGSGIDYKGRGGFVLGPGSFHYSGVAYEWLKGATPADVQLAELPPWIAERCRRAGGNGRDSSPRPADYFARLVVSKVGEGARNDTVLRLVGHLLWTGKVSPHVALEFARMWNEKHSAPPMSDDEVIRIVDSVCGRELLKRRGR